MEEFKMTIEKMITELDTACGMLIVASMTNKEVFEAKEKIMSVSIALGEMGYENELAEEDLNEI